MRSPPAITSPRIRDFPRSRTARFVPIPLSFGCVSLQSGTLFVARTVRRRVTYRPQTGVPCWLTEPLHALYNRAPVWITKSHRP
jgi:hypothetical protein